MSLTRRELALVLVLALVSACQSNREIYERPLIENNVLSSEPIKRASIEPYPYAVASLMPQYRPDAQSMEAGLWMTVEKAEKKTKTAGNRVTDKRINDYLHTIICRLSKQYCNDIRVYVMRVPMFNATMSPNGMMHVWTGLLLRVQNEAQLAAVLGHEIGHYLRRHSLQRFRNIINTGNALIFAQMALAVAGVPRAGDLMTLAASGNFAAFGRDHEREADGYGLLFLAKGGYDPAEASKVWRRLIREKEADKKYSTPSLFTATHPQSEERMDILEDLAKRVSVDGIAETGQERFEAVFLPMRATYLRDELHQRNFGRTEALLDMLIEDGANIAELHFFKGELYRLRKKNGDQEKALESYQTSMKLGAPPPEVFRQIALVQHRLGDKNGAITSLQKYLLANPNAEDAQVIKQLIKRFKAS
jgi:beta-barrel assembly-enhancing protease